jgi:phosphogluconate dehydratase
MFSPTGGLKLLTGNLGRSVIKVSAVPAGRRVIEAPARVFSAQDELLRAFNAGQLAPPEAAAGGPLAKLRDGDRVRLDADAGTLQAWVPEAEWAARDRAQLPPARKVANSHGVGREWVSAFRRNAPAAQEGAGTWP